VLIVKQEVESELGIRPREACDRSCVFSRANSKKGHTEKLKLHDDETLDDLLGGEKEKEKRSWSLELLLIVAAACCST